MSVTWRWLYLRCVLWGLATGAGGGAAFGLLGGADYFGTADGAAVGALTGAVYGVVVALIPSLLGAAIVTDAMGGRQDFRPALGIAFAIVAAGLDLCFLAGIALWSDGGGLLYLLVTNVGALPVLWWGWTSISKASARAGEPDQRRCRSMVWLPSRDRY